MSTRSMLKVGVLVGTIVVVVVLVLIVVFRYPPYELTVHTEDPTSD
jgi:hypothetical protein